MGMQICQTLSDLPHLETASVCLHMATKLRLLVGADQLRVCMDWARLGTFRDGRVASKSSACTAKLNRGHWSRRLECR
jgi:hypothetical protein